MLSFNQELFLALNSYAGHSRVWDTLGIVLGEGLPYLFIAVEVWLYFFAKRKEEALLAFYAVLLGLGISKLISLIYFHPRPFMDKLGTLLVHHGADSSFPSDHTTFMASIALTLLFLPATRRLGDWLILLAALGGMARVFEGVHYPLNILGGLGVGLISAEIVVALAPRLKPLNVFVFRMEDLIFRRKTASERG